MIVIAFQENIFYTLTTKNNEKNDEISKWKQEENSPNDIEVINFYRRCLVHGNANL